jgi:hypothetical protein
VQSGDGSYLDADSVQGRAGLLQEFAETIRTGLGSFIGRVKAARIERHEAEAHSARIPRTQSILSVSAGRGFLVLESGGTNSVFAGGSAPFVLPSTVGPEMSRYVVKSREGEVHIRDGKALRRFFERECRLSADRCRAKSA